MVGAGPARRVVRRLCLRHLLLCLLAKREEAEIEGAVLDIRRPARRRGKQALDPGPIPIRRVGAQHHGFGKLFEPVCERAGKFAPRHARLPALQLRQDVFLDELLAVVQGVSVGKLGIEGFGAGFLDQTDRDESGVRTDAGEAGRFGVWAGCSRVSSGWDGPTPQDNSVECGSRSQFEESLKLYDCRLYNRHFGREGLVANFFIDPLFRGRVVPNYGQGRILGQCIGNYAKPIVRPKSLNMLPKSPKLFGRQPNSAIR